MEKAQPTIVARKKIPVQQPRDVQKSSKPVNKIWAWKCLIPEHHQSSIVGICTNHKCKDQKLLCMKCLMYTHKSCSQNILLLEEFLSCDSSQLLSIPCFKEVKALGLEQMKPNAKSEDKTILLTELDVLLNEEFASIKTSFEAFLNDCQAKVKQALEKQLKTIESSVSLKNKVLSDIINRQEIKKLLLEIESEEKNYNSDAKTGRINQFFENYWEGLSERIKSYKGHSSMEITSILQSLETKRSEIRQVYKKFKRLFEKEITQAMSFGSTSPWYLDPEAKDRSIKLSNDYLTATKASGTGHAIVYGNIPFEKATYTWEVTLGGITRENGDWIEFGLIDKEKYEVVDFGTPNLVECYALTSAGYYNNHLLRMVNCYGSIQNFNGQTFLCEYDAEIGHLIITGDAFKAEARDLKGKLYPFVSFYHQGNTATIKMLSGPEDSKVGKLSTELLDLLGGSYFEN